MNRSFPPVDHPPPNLPLVRFRLWHLLLAVAAVSALLAVLMTLSGHSRLVLLVGVAAVAAHVVATILGLQLRRHADRRRQWYLAHSEMPDRDESAATTGTSSRPFPAPATSTLSVVTTRMGRLPLLTVVGALVSGVGGGWGLSATIGSRISLAGLLLGAASAAALGAWMAFAMGGFVGISRQAWREAIKPHPSNRS